MANILSTIKIRLILNIINQSIKIPLKLSFKTPIKLTFVHISHFVVLLDAEHKSNSILIACPKQCQPRANSVRKAMTVWQYDSGHDTRHLTLASGGGDRMMGPGPRSAVPCWCVPAAPLLQTVCSFPAFSCKHQQHRHRTGEPHSLGSFTHLQTGKFQYYDVNHPSLDNPNPCRVPTNVAVHCHREGCQFSPPLDFICFRTQNCIS